MSTQTLEHPVFGRLAWAAEEQAWKGAVVFGAAAVNLKLFPSEEQKIPDEYGCLFRTLSNNQARIVSDVVAWVQTELAHWLKDTEDQSAEALERQIRVTSVDIYAVDGVTVWLEGPDPIAASGHCIEGRFGKDAVLDYFCLTG